jgi:hypothetical protein
MQRSGGTFSTDNSQRSSTGDESQASSHQSRHGVDIMELENVAAYQKFVVNRTRNVLVFYYFPDV